MQLNVKKVENAVGKYNHLEKIKKSQDLIKEGKKNLKQIKRELNLEYEKIIKEVSELPNVISVKRYKDKNEDNFCGRCNNEYTKAIVLGINVKYIKEYNSYESPVFDSSYFHLFTVCKSCGTIDRNITINYISSSISFLEKEKKSLKKKN